jgi:hypothetical protein
MLNVAVAQESPSFKPLRYDEDYKKDSSHTNWYSKAKYSPLSAGGNTYISFGGEVRLQYFYIKNDSWGDEPEDKDGYVLSRYLLHADIHASKHFRTFLQVQSSIANGKSSTSPVDENPLDLHQAFVDYSVELNAKTKMLLRLGRQELSYGSQRLVSVRDGPNNRQAFDGAKVGITHEKYRFDLFYSHYVASKKDIFDDGWNKNMKFWGSYVTLNKIPVLQNIDVYYLGLWRSNAKFDDGSGSELRHSVGARFFGKQHAVKYDLEALYQFGNFNNQDISAWTASVNMAYQFNHLEYRPEIGLKTELISGDKNYGDNRIQTFNPLFPRGAYFGLAALIGPSNLIDIHPSLSFELTPRLDWNMDYDIFWRYSLNDGIYAPNTSLMYSGKNSARRNIGQQVSTEFVYIPNPFLYFRVEFTWFKTEAYLKDVTAGKDILFTGITAQVKF